jgi:hypothetical protein
VSDLDLVAGVVAVGAAGLLLGVVPVGDLGDVSLRLPVEQGILGVGQR